MQAKNYIFKFMTNVSGGIFFFSKRYIQKKNLNHRTEEKISFFVETKLLVINFSKLKLKWSSTASKDTANFAPRRL